MKDNFQLISTLPILHGKLSEYKHKSGARIFHVENSDRDKAFSIAFPTPPTDNTGVAHILEHIVLSGSQRFAVHDPFFSMLQRGVHTFMNAFTSDDFTCYVAASQNEHDISNLLDVYLDAVFHPLLSEESFRQEGWRLEEGGTIGGVVYNEMKGTYSAIEHRLEQAIKSALFPNNCYGYDSGGDPKSIPHLTHGQLKAFHAAHYHPSRAVIYLYGDISLQTTFAKIDPFLGEGAALDPCPLQLQPRFTTPRNLQSSFPGSEEKRVAIAFLTCQRSAVDEVEMLAVLDGLLMGHEGSPLRRALLDIPGCRSVDSQLNTDVGEVSYVLICRGDVSGQKVLQTIENALENLDPSTELESALLQQEIAHRVRREGRVPHSLSLFFDHVAPIFQGADPGKLLQIEERCQRLRKQCTGQSLRELIDKHILSNPHRVMVTMEGDPSLRVSETAAERELALNISSEEIGSEDIALRYWQTESDDQLPLLPLEEIELKETPLPLVRKDGIIHHPCQADGLSYASLVFPQPPLSKEEWNLLPIMLTILPKLGCAGRSADAWMSYLQTHAAGVRGYPLLIGDRQHVALEGHSLDKDQQQLIDSLAQMSERTMWQERKRIEGELHKLRSEMRNALAESALPYALAEALAMLGIRSENRGIEILIALEKLLTNHDYSFADLYGKAFSGTGDLILSSKDLQSEFIPSQGTTMRSESKDERGKSERWRAKWLEVAVSFTVRAFAVSKRNAKAAAPLALVAPLARRLVLHPRIREQGGAYGSGGHYLAERGAFYFFTYRDPHVKLSLEAFEEGIERLASGNFGTKDLHQAKLAAFQELDKPLSPVQRGMTAYRWEKDNWHKEQRAHFRQQIFKCSKEEVIEVVSKELRDGATVTYGNKELLERELSGIRCEALIPRVAGA